MEPATVAAKIVLLVKVSDLLFLLIGQGGPTVSGHFAPYEAQLGKACDPA
jgi:hypothetical protein